MSTNNILKCKFCKWQISRFITTKKGKRINKSGALISHVALEHPDVYKKIIEACEEYN